MCTASGRIIGYNYNYMTDLEYFLPCLGMEAAELLAIDGRADENKLGICKSMGILSEYREQGYALALLRYGVVQLYQMGATSLWGTASFLQAKALYLRRRNIL